MVYYTLGWYFMIYAVLGWCAEVAFAAVTTGKFVNRGFLDGPLCPVYGFGVLLVLITLEPVAQHFILLFLGSMILTSALEFLAGFLLERVFHEKWWDYSDMPFNIKGYVCPKFSLMWGMACVLVVRVIHPTAEGLVALIPVRIGLICLGVLYVLLLADLAGTVTHLVKIRRTLRSVERINGELRKISDSMGEKISDGVLGAMAVQEKVEQKKLEMQENMDQKRQELQARTSQLRERLTAEQNRLPEWTSRRLLDAYPKLRKRLEIRSEKHSDKEKQ